MGTGAAWVVTGWRGVAGPGSRASFEISLGFLRIQSVTGCTNKMYEERGTVLSFLFDFNFEFVVDVVTRVKNKMLRC